MTDAEEARERAAAVLEGFRQTCPDYPALPTWACNVLHLLTGIVRNVTYGHFYRFKEHRFDLLDPASPNRVEHEMWSRSPWIACPHHPKASGDSFWRTRGASTTDPLELYLLDKENRRLR